MRDGQHCRVHIRVRAETTFGQAVALGGNCNALGGFHLNKVIKLVTTPESYPIWFTATPVVLPKNTVVEYKYGIIEGGFCKSFEPGSCRHMEATEWDTIVEDELNTFMFSGAGHDSDQDLLNEITAFADTDTIRLDDRPLLKPFAEQSRLFLVCYHLPVVVTRVEGGDGIKVAWGESLISKSSDSISRDAVTFWIGTVKVPGGHSSLTPDEKTYLINKLRSMNCIPLFIEEDLARMHYSVYCKQVLWPVYHNVDQLDHIHAAWRSAEWKEGESVMWREQSEISYKDYVAVNALFADELKKLVQAGDTIWVHDYHLTLLPRMIRKFVSEAVDAHAEAAAEAGSSSNSDAATPTSAPGTAEMADGSRCAASDVSIVFFLHIPFPTSQIFRSLPNAVDLLESMVCADVVGFHAFDYTRHFINACKRMLGIRSKHRPGGLLSLSAGDHDVIVTMSVVSIEAALVQAAVQSNEAQLIAVNLRAKYSGRKIIVGVDTCNRLSGVGQKLKAYERLLRDFSSASREGKPGRNGFRGVGYDSALDASTHSHASTQSLTSDPTVVLVQRCLRSGTRPRDEEQTSLELRETVQGLNHLFGNEVVDYEELPSMTLAERVGLWLAADVFLLTPIREGLNLMPHEFIYSRKDVSNAGVVVASEFSACCTLLNGALKCNPFNPTDVADMLDKALQMDTTERDRRRHRDLKFVSNNSSSRWTRMIVKEIQGLQRSKNLSAMAKLSNTTSADMLSQMVVVPSPKSPPKPEPSGVKTTSLMPLMTNSDIIRDAYTQARLMSSSLPEKGRRVFILDYGGTLLHKERYDIYIKQSLSAISGRRPTPKMMSAIKRLSSDPSNVVLVITGLTRLKMGTIFDDIPDLTFATSNGLVYHWGRNLRREDEKEFLMMEGVDAEEAKWKTMDFDIDWNEVKKVAVPIMTKFVFRTNGTCLTPRIPGIGWSYFGSDPDWGEKQSTQLRVELEASLAKFDVKIVSQIQGSIEIVPKGLTKGVFVEHFMERVMSHRAGVLPTFTTVIGDDLSDDVMFQSLYNVVAAAGPGSRPANMRSFTIVVGKRVSPADTYLLEVSDVEDLLVSLANDPSTHPQEEPSEQGLPASAL